MTDSHTAGEQVQEEILKTVRNSQSAVIEAIQTWARTVQSITPALPDVNVPFADKLPKPQELISNAYDFAEQLLASQRKFAEEVLKATASILPGQDDAPAK
jgi:plasmid maintenance system antidote protein VapI